MATDVASADRERRPDKDSHPKSVDEELPAASAAGATGTSLGERQVQAAAAPTAKVGAAEDPAEQAADDKADQVMRAMGRPEPPASGGAGPAAAGAAPVATPPPAGGTGATVPDQPLRRQTPASETATPTAAPAPSDETAPAARPAGGGESSPTEAGTAVTSPEQPIRRQAEVTTPGGSAPVVAGPEAPGGGAQRPGPAETGTPAPEAEPPAPEGEQPARGTPAVSADVQEYLDASRGQGRPIPEGPRKQFEDQFQRSFAAVGIHDDSAADDAAKSIDALAFTRGNDIYFRAGAYDATSPAGKRLLAHELAHVAQQRPGVNRKAASGLGDAVVRRAKNKGDSGSKKEKKPKGTATSFEVPKDVDPTDKDAGKAPAGKLDASGKKPELVLDRVFVPTFKVGFHSGVLTWNRKPRTDTHREKWRAPAGANLVTSLKGGPAKSGMPPHYFQFGPDSKAKLYLGTEADIGYALSTLPYDRAVPAKGHDYEIDHKQEDQLGGPDDVTNLWLLDRSTNRGSGPAIHKSIERDVLEFLRVAGPKLAKQPSIGDLTVKFKQAVAGPNPQQKSAAKVWTKALGPSDSWELGDLAKPEAVAGLKPMSAKTRERATGSKTQLAIFTKRGGGAVQSLPFDFTSGNIDLKKFFGRGFKVEAAQYTGGDPPSGGHPPGTKVGSITVGFFKNVKVISVPDRTFDITAMSGVLYGGLLDTTPIRAMAKEAAGSPVTTPVASPIAFPDLDFDLVQGLTGKGSIPKPSVKLLENVDFAVALDGDDVGIEAIITGGSLKLPGPFQVIGGLMTLKATNGGVSIDGRVDFEIEKLATGYLQAAASTKAAAPGFALEGGLDFDTELFDKASLKLSYIDGKWGVEGELAVGPGKVKGINKASAKVAFADEVLTADGTFEPAIKGIKSGKVGLRYAEATGMEITGLIELGEGVPGIKSGKLDATIKQSPAGGWSLAGGVSIEPAIPGVTAAITGRYDDGAFNVAGTLGYERGIAKGSVTIGVTNAPVGEDGKITGPPVPDGALIPYGAGLVTLQMTPWLKGTVGLKLKPNGEIEVSGEVALPSTFDLFPEKKVEKQLVSIGVDIPIIGVAAAGQRIGVFATVKGGISIAAGFGPGQLRNAALKVTYNPDHPDDTRATGTAQFYVPASAGLRLSVDGGLGVGIPVVSATAGLSVYGQIGVAGAAAADAAVTWTPTAGVVLDAKGEIFVEPKFKFGVNAFVDVSLDLVLTTIELYRREWNLASFEYGSNMRFGLMFPLHYESGKPFELSFDQVQWTYPQIDPLDVIGGLVKQLVG